MFRIDTESEQSAAGRCWPVASSVHLAAAIGPWTDAYNLARSHSGIAGSHFGSA